MARRLRSPTLETRTARLKLKVRRKPYFLSVAPGISLGYRRNLGAGSWLVRCADGKGGAWTQGFATADDFEDVDGNSVLDFWTAQTPGYAPTTKIIASMTESDRTRLKRAVREQMPAAPEGVVEYFARANAIKARVP